MSAPERRMREEERSVYGTGLFRRTVPAFIALGMFAVLLAGCTGQTTVDQPSSIGNYGIAFSVDPQRMNPPQQATLNYGLTDSTTGKPVTKLDTIYGALIHNVIISRDLRAFHHSYASQSLLNQFSLPSAFLQLGKYYSYTLFKPTGDKLQVLTGTIQTGDEGNAPDLRVDTGPRTSYGSLYTLALSSNPIQAGKPVQLAIYVTERGQPVQELWPFLDAPGYLWIVDQNGENFAVETGSAEGHPMAGSTNNQPVAAPTFMPGLQSALATVTAQPVPTLLPAQATSQVSVLQTPGLVTPNIGYGPVVAFTHTFPKAGFYKIWAEMEYRAQLVQIDWTLNVTAP